MSVYGLVKPTLEEILPQIRPSREDKEVRLLIIQDVRDAVQTVERLRGATVEPFGSFVSNHYSRGTDLNITINTYRGPYILNAWKSDKADYLKDVRKALTSTGTWRRLNLVPVTDIKVPVLKLEHKLQNIPCHITINDLNYQVKSKFLFWINGIDGRFRDMVLLVKEWAKRHGLNESKTECLNSYCLSLLVIFHFQTCVPAIIPPLQELYPGDLAHDLSGARTDVVEQIEGTFAASINRFQWLARRNQSSLSDLLVSFFAKFSDIDVRALEQGINPYSGQWEDIGRNMAWLSQTFALYVEDPFEQPKNTASTITNDHLTRIADAVRATHCVLSSHDHNMATLFATLARQDWLHVTRSSFRNHSNPGNYSWSHQHDNRAASTSSQSHPRHNVRNQGRSNNGNVNRPVQPNQNQGRSNNGNLNRPVQPNQNQGRSNNGNMNRPVQPNQNQGSSSNANVNRLVQPNQNQGRSNHRNLNRPVQPNQNQGSSSNANVNRPVQPNQNQAQQIWRARPKS